MIRRFWIPFGVAIFIISLIETSIYVLRKPSFWDKTTWLLHDPYRSEPFDRLIVYEKLNQLINQKPDIISVGDSSGFFSIQPNIVNRYLQGLKYVSLSTGGNQAFLGYQAIAEYMLQRQPSVKYVVLNMYPNLLPSKEMFRTADLAPIEYDDLVSIKAWLTPPSTSLSPYAKSLFFYHKRYHPKEPLSNHKVYLEVHHSIGNTLGWAPEHDIPYNRVWAPTPFYPDREKRIETLYGLFEPSAILSTLTDFAKMCRKYNAKLLIMFNPMPWSAIYTNDDLYVAEKKLEEFQLRNPDVIFLTDKLITPWDPAKFGMYNHISRAYVHESSARMGLALQKALYQPKSLPPFKASWKLHSFPQPKDITVVTKANAEQKQAALAYYLYTATTEKEYWKFLSTRVQHVLQKNKPFQWMIADLKRRNRDLLQKNIHLSYDTTKIDAEIISMKGGYYCGKSTKVEWVRLSGVMQFGLSSPQEHISEPVVWPASSYVIIPIIREANTYKFDGYCSSPGEAHSA